MALCCSDFFVLYVLETVQAGCLRYLIELLRTLKAFYISFTFFYRLLTSAGIKKNSFVGGFEKINKKTRKSIYAVFNDCFLHFLRTKANWTIYGTILMSASLGSVFRYDRKTVKDFKRVSNNVYCRICYFSLINMVLL